MTTHDQVATMLLGTELMALPIEDLEFLKAEIDWSATAHDYQREPAGAWTVWAIMAGRGSGKTRTGASWCRKQSYQMRGSIGHVIAPTHSDLRGTCFEGPAGLLKAFPESMIEDYNRSLSELRLKNGTLIRGFSADTPDRLRGPQAHWAWCDEAAAWQRLEEAWSNIVFSTRLPFERWNERHRRIDAYPVRKLITTTPRPLEFLRKLETESHDPKSGVVITRGSSYANRKHLDDSFFKEIEQYEGTLIGRQEIHGELIDPEEQGVVKRSWFKLWPASEPLPELEYVVYSLDTAFTEASQDMKRRDEPTQDPTACTVWGVFVHTDEKTKQRRYNLILLDCWQGYYGLPDLIERVKKEYPQRWGKKRLPKIPVPYGPRHPTPDGKGIDIILIEDKASGPSLRQMLERESYPAFPYNPGAADKLARLHAVSHIPSSGRVWLPESVKRPGQPRDWIEPWLGQICVYSGKKSLKHEDYVDATTQAWRLLADKYLSRGVARKDDFEGIYDQVPPDENQSRNPYAA
jgi:hypothetical protein